MPGERKDPYSAFRFAVEVTGLVIGGFSEVSGAAAEVETEDYQEGGEHDFVHKLLKGLKHQNLQLRHGIIDSDALWKWFRASAQGRPQCKDVRIILLDDQGKDTISWRCKKAYPVKWTGPELKSGSSEVGIESLELVHAGIERV